MKIDDIVSKSLTEFNCKLSPRHGEENRPNCGECELIDDKLSVKFLWGTATELSVEAGMTGKNNQLSTCVEALITEWVYRIISEAFLMAET